MTLILENWPNGDPAPNWNKTNILGPNMIFDPGSMFYSVTSPLAPITFFNDSTHRTWDLFAAKDGLGSSTLPPMSNGAYVTMYLASPEICISYPMCRLNIGGGIGSTNISTIRLSIEPGPYGVLGSNIISVSGGTTPGFNSYDIDFTKPWYRWIYNTGNIILSNSVDGITWTVIEIRGFSPGASTSVFVEFERDTLGFGSMNADNPKFLWGPTVIRIPSGSGERPTYTPNITGSKLGESTDFAPPKSR